MSLRTLIGHQFGSVLFLVPFDPNLPLKLQQVLGNVDQFLDVVQSTDLERLNLWHARTEFMVHHFGHKGHQIALFEHCAVWHLHHYSVGTGSHPQSGYSVEPLYDEPGQEVLDDDQDAQVDNEEDLVEGVGGPLAGDGHVVRTGGKGVLEVA